MDVWARHLSLHCLASVISVFLWRFVLRYTWLSGPISPMTFYYDTDY